MYLTDKLEHIINSLPGILPEVILCAGTVVALLIAMLRKKRDAFPELAAIAALCLSLFFSAQRPHVVTYDFLGFLRVTPWLTKGCMLVDAFGLILIILSMLFEDRKKLVAEYMCFILFAIVSVHFVLLSANWIALFLSIEGLSITGYGLVALKGDKISFKEGLKYLIYGSVASAIMLYGISFLYGLSGSMQIHESIVFSLDRGGMLFWLGFILMTAGVLFKLSAAPFHFWAPNVYEASSLSVASFIAVVPKVAGAYAFWNIYHALFSDQSGWDMGLKIILAVAVLSFVIGNLSAYRENSPLRVIAFSSVTHTIFFMLPVLNGEAGQQFLFVYLAVYGLASMVAITILRWMDGSDANTFAPIAGVGKVRLWLGLSLIISIVSMAGLPPTVGFSAKFVVLMSTWEAYSAQGNTMLLWLFIIGGFNVVLSLGYYLKFPYYTFFKERDTTTVMPNVKSGQKAVLLLLSLTLIALFFVPGLLF